MKQIVICLTVLISVAGFSQENKISSVLTLAVKEAQGWNSLSQTPDFTFYNRNYRCLLQQSNLTSDILDRRMNMVYVDNDKFYSNTYIPITAQQHNSSLTVDNYYRMEKMYALPDPVNTRK